MHVYPEQGDALNNIPTTGKPGGMFLFLLALLLPAVFGPVPPVFADAPQDAVVIVGSEIDKSFECLNRAVEHGFANRTWTENDPDLDPLREDPRYQELLAALPG